MTRDRKFLLAELFFIAGVAVFPFVDIELWILFFAAGICVILMLFFKNKRAEIFFLIALAFIAAFIRFDFIQRNTPGETELQEFNGKKIRIECEIVSMPEMKKDKQQIVLETVDGSAIRGKILAYASPYSDFDYGDAVEFEGVLKVPENFEGFDYRRYLANKGIYLVSYYPTLSRINQREGGFYGMLYDFRRAADANIIKVLPTPQAGIVSAMTLGMDSPEIEEAMERFNKTGTSHVIAVSGFHMVVITAIMMFLLLGLGVNRNKIFYLVSLGILCFIIVSGSASSAIRSGIMAFVFLLAVSAGRGKNAFNALIFSAFLMILINPSILAGDVGFQLSFLATFGLICFLPVLQAKFRQFPSWGGTKEILLTTFAAQLAVLPVLVYSFGQFSLLSFAANLIILPIVPVVMVGGFALIAVSFMNMELAKIIAFPIYLLMSYMLWAIDWLSGTDWGMIKFQ